MPNIVNNISFIHYTSKPYEPGTLPFNNNSVIETVDMKGYACSINGIRSMDQYFNNCRNLRSVINISNDPPTLYLTFANCPSLTYVSNIPSSCTSLEGTFINCTSFNQQIDIPSSVTNMSSTFSGCSSLNQQIAIPYSVTNLVGTFNGCSSLTSNNLPILLRESYNMNATFSGCSSLTYTPDISKFYSIRSTFSGCSSLTTIVGNFRSGTTSLNSTFYGCTSLSESAIPPVPATVTDLIQAFANCTSFVNPPTINCTDAWGTGTFDGCTNLISTPDLSKFKGLNYAFRNCSSLTTIVGNLKSSITDLYETFRNCTSLTNIPSLYDYTNLTSLSYTFKGCTGLINAPILPQNVTSLVETFRDCTNLTTAPEIPATVTNMEGTFFNCTSLTGNIIIRSSDINNIGTMFSDVFFQTTLPKYVYIPYNSTTHNTFLSMGYDDIGTRYGVYLRDISTL